MIILIPKACLTRGVLAYEFSIRIKFFLLDRESCAFSSSNVLGQKSVFSLNCKFLQTLIHTEKTRESIINVYMVFHRCSVFFYGQQGVYWIVWSKLLTFLIILTEYSTKKVYETYWCMPRKKNGLDTLNIHF